MSEKETVALDYVMQYEKFITEEGLDIKKFPAAIGVKVRTLKMLVGKYNAKPSDGRKQHIIREDIATANLMADWKEKDYPDEFIDPTPTSEEFIGETPAVVTPVAGTPPVVVTPVAGTPPVNVTPVAGTPPVETPPVAGTPPVETPAAAGTPPDVSEEDAKKAAEEADKTATMQKQVMENKEGNRIKIHVLTQIIGKKPSETIINIGKITLRKVFMCDAYEII